MPSDEEQNRTFDWDSDVLLTKFGLGSNFLLAALLVVVMFFLATFGVIHTLVGNLVGLSTSSQVITVSIGLFDVVTSGLLTFVLIYVYWDIRHAERGQEKLMEQQKDILKEQQDMRNATIQPELQCKLLSEEASDDHAFVKCYNDGPGRADDIEFHIELFVWKGQVDQLYRIEGQSLSPLTEIGESTIHESERGPIPVEEGFSEAITNVMYASDGAVRRGSQAAVDGRDEERFRFTVRVNHWRGGHADPTTGRYKPIERITERLSELDVGAVGYRLSIDYGDIMGEEVEEYTFSSGIAKLQSEMSFEDIIDSSSGKIVTTSFKDMTMHRAVLQY
jgi:hypothetical protein